MIYRIAFEADKHWGAMNVTDQYRSSYILKKFLAEYPIDAYVYLGDFFDTKLLLNSKSSIYAVKDFSEKMEICKARGIPCRVIKGTRSHDYDQWDIFAQYMADSSYNFRYFKTCSVEETLPGLTIWYAPEENMNFADYIDRYYDIITARPINMACMHGNFDRIMPSIALSSIENNSDSTTLVFHYDDLVTIVRGPMVAGHWHDADTSDHLSYVGSYDRWSFGEDEEKGFAIYEYNTETYEYRKVKVPNFFAPAYVTYEIRTSIFRDADDYTALANRIEQHLIADRNAHIRILCRVDEMLADTPQQIENIRLRFTGDRRVHYTMVNQLKHEKKKVDKKVKERRDEIYSFIYDPNMELADKIQKYIMVTTGRQYRPKDIKTLIERYTLK